MQHRKKINMNRFMNKDITWSLLYRIWINKSYPQLCGYDYGKRIGIPLFLWVKNVDKDVFSCG